MYKKLIVILIIILCFGNLPGCNNSGNYPKLKITAGNTDISYYEISEEKETDVYEYVFEKNPEMLNLAEVNTNDMIIIDFKGKNPDELSIEYELLTVPYFNDFTNLDSTISAVQPPFKTIFDISDDKYNFTVEKFDETKYEFLFAPLYYSFGMSLDLCYIAGRVYKINASWGENKYSYAFVLKNRDDIDKGDVAPMDMNSNVNVMLKRTDNWQKIIDEPVISQEDMKIIDGSTATIPITAELFRQFWNYSDKYLNENYYNLFWHNTTHYAYINLIDRRYGNSTPQSLIFVTPPSEEEKAFAEELGVELDITPIAKDGFVFITHKDNPVESLTVKQIQAIYTGEITNWKELGGEDLEILAYQREANSGSQTAMEQMVMQGKQLIKPIETSVIGGMGELVENIASEYQNGGGSIGYTYYYYINNLYKNENIKVLKINGITPDNENLLNETYPFTANYYAVMRADEAENSPARKLRDFLLTEQGQRIIEIAGYCRSVN